MLQGQQLRSVAGEKSSDMAFLEASEERGGRGAAAGAALTFSSVCTNCSTGIEPLSRGFSTLQSGMSSLARFLFLPPLGWAGLGGG